MGLSKGLIPKDKVCGGMLFGKSWSKVRKFESQGWQNGKIEDDFEYYECAAVCPYQYQLKSTETSPGCAASYDTGSGVSGIEANKKQTLDMKINKNKLRMKTIRKMKTKLIQTKSR